MSELSGVTGRVVLITGAGRANMGRAAAHLFAAHGARVVVTDVSQVGLEETASEVRAAGGEVMALVVDMLDEASVEDLVGQTCRSFGTVHSLLNFAAVQGPRHGTMECAPADWDRIVGVTLKGTWLVSKHAMGVMRENEPVGTKGWRGSIVTISSAVTHQGVAGNAVAYVAAKAGILGLTRAMAVDGASHRIRVNCISPGLTRGPSTPLEEGSDAEQQAISRRHLLPYISEPADQAQAALWLCSDAARTVTGAILSVDCGWTAR